MIYTAEVQHMCPVAKGAYHGPAPIPEEGKWVQAKEIKDISGFTHGVGWCAPQQGACNTAMRELFLQIVYGRSQSAFSEGGLAVGASMEDLGKGLRSQVGTMFATKEKGPRYLEMAEGYCTKIALNKDDEIIGYEFINFGKMMDFIKAGIEPAEAMKKAQGHYGQWDNAAKYIDPRKD